MQTYILYLFVVLGISITQHVAAQCPSTMSGLTKWSSVSEWMTTGASVNISVGQSILMDVSPPELNYVNIFGTLYITDASDITVNTRYISVYAGGVFVVGTAGCPITQKVIVSFYGPRSNHSQDDMGFDSFDGVGLGSKGLSVRTNGTLLVNGWWQGAAWTNLAEIANANQNTLVLREAVSWQPGDQIVITSTDYSMTLENPIYPSISWWIQGNGAPEQTEMATIQSVSGNIVTLTAPLNYTHWAGHYQYAEVGLLTRRIVFQGAEDSEAVEFGGHVILRKALQIQIIGAEFFRMGQKGLLGRYPIHFHFIHDASNLNYLVQQSSSHHNYFRSLTIHETYGVTVRDVVAYMTNGHMFFLEEGGEHNNTFDHNLGAVTNPIPQELMQYGISMSVIPTDNEPSVFWITNPANYWTNNSAVGGKFGYWFTLPAFPIGDSYDYWMSVNPNYHPYTLPLGLFYNNTAHSNGVHCLNIDRGINSTGGAPGGDVNPGGNPYWGNNDIVFQKSTIYKCRGSTLWSITALQHSGGIFVDAATKSVFFNGDAAVHDSIFVGASANVGIVPWGRGLTGLSTYDVGGDQNSYNNVFINFTGSYNGYINGAQAGLGTGMVANCISYNNTFINAVPYTNSPIKTEQGTFIWNDLDGSATGVPNGAYIVSANQPISLPVHASCSFNTTIPNSYVCTRDDGNFYVRLAFTDVLVDLNYYSYSDTLLNGTVLPAMPIRSVTRFNITDMADPTRTGTTTASDHGLPCAWNDYSGQICESIEVNLPPRRMINLKFVHNTLYRASPSQYRLQLDYTSPGDWMFVSLPYPTTASFVLTDGITGAPLTQVSSFAQMTNSSYFFYDSSTELLWTFLKAEPSTYRTRIVQAISYNYASTNVIDIQATCQNNLCQPDLAKLETNFPPPPLPFVENIYFARLENSQVVPATTATTGLGLVQIWHYPIWNEVHIAVLHNLVAYQPVISIGFGAYGSAGTLTDFAIPGSLAKVALYGTPALLSALYTGNLYVQIDTNEYPNGHVRSQLYCNGTCTQPVIMAEVNQCKPPSDTSFIFNDGVLAPGFVTGVYNLSEENYGISKYSLCGNSSLYAQFEWGQFSISSSNNHPYVVTPAFSYLEFYIKAAFGDNIINPQIWLRTNVSYNSISLNLANYALGGQLDSADGFQLVSIPISAFQIGSTFKLESIIFSNPYYAVVDVYFDQVRFVSKPAATYNYGASLKAGVSPTPTGPTSPATSPTTAPGTNYPVYIGCYIDFNPRDLPNQMTSISNSAMTVESCEKACLAANFAYAGVQYGGECRCGNTYGTYGVADASDCSMPCNGDSSEICGSAWRNSIYQVADAPAKVTSNNIRNSATRRGATSLFVLLLISSMLVMLL